MKAYRHLLAAAMALMCSASCDRARPATRSFYASDSLPFLVSNSDVIGTVVVTSRGGASGVVRHCDAQIVELLKGNEVVGSKIRILAEPASGFGCPVMLPECTYVAFLKKAGDNYMPVTDMAMAWVHEDYVIGIWTRKNTLELEYAGQDTNTAFRSILKLVRDGSPEDADQAKSRSDESVAGGGAER